MPLVVPTHIRLLLLCARSNAPSLLLHRVVGYILISHSAVSEECFPEIIHCLTTLCRYYWRLHRVKSSNPFRDPYRLRCQFTEPLPLSRILLELRFQERILKNVHHITSKPINKF